MELADLAGAERYGQTVVTRTPLIHQSEAAECGLACLAMVYGHYESAVDLRTLRNDFLTADQVGGQGVTLKSLGSCASALGFVHRALRAEPEHIRDVRLPAILHWDMNHFVVLVKARARSCVLHDPAMGRRDMTWQELGKHFTGVVLELWPGGPLRKLATPVAKLRLRELWQLVRGGGVAIGWVFVLSGYCSCRCSPGRGTGFYEHGRYYPRRWRAASSAESRGKRNLPRD